MIDQPQFPGQLNLTISIILRFWWSFVWRSMLLSFAWGFLVGFILSLGGISATKPIPGQIVIYLGALLVGPYVLKSILQMNFGHFKTCLIEQSTSREPVEISPTFIRHGLIVWWAWVWRWLIWGVVFLPVAIVAAVIVGRILGLSEVARYYSAFGFGFLSSTLAAIYSLRLVLQKDFKTFKVLFLPHT